MTLHPARALASVLLIGGSLAVGVTSLAVVIAKLLVGAGMATDPSDALLLSDLIAVLPFIVAFAIAGFVAAAGILVGKSWADDVALGTAIVAVAVARLPRHISTGVTA